MAVRLPAPIDRYFEASNAADGSAVAAVFTEDASVRDENADHHGRDAIALWAAVARETYSFIAEPRSFEPTATGGVVTAHLTGDFPGAPADLRYSFTLDDDLISGLEITARPASAELLGRRILVTGGSQGIGAAIVRSLRKAGAVVFTTARSTPEGLDHPDLFIAADASTPDGAAKAAAAALARLGGIDAVIHNVGGSSAPGGGHAALDDAAWSEAIETNLMSAVRIDRALLPSMLAQGYGVVIHVTSIQRLLPLYDSTTAYAAAKAALGAYSKALSNEVGPQGVRVVRVSPGFTQTDAASRLIERLAAGEGTDFDTARTALIQSLGGIPIGRPNSPEEVADLIAFLTSDRAATIHGVEYTIDGGSVPTV